MPSIIFRKEFKMKNNFNKFLSVFLIIALTFTSFGIFAFADEENQVEYIDLLSVDTSLPTSYSVSSNNTVIWNYTIFLENISGDYYLNLDLSANNSPIYDNSFGDYIEARFVVQQVDSNNNFIKTNYLIDYKLTDNLSVSNLMPSQNSLYHFDSGFRYKINLRLMCYGCSDYLNSNRNTPMTEDRLRYILTQEYIINSYYLASTKDYVPKDDNPSVKWLSYGGADLNSVNTVTALNAVEFSVYTGSLSNHNFYFYIYDTGAVGDSRGIPIYKYNLIENCKPYTTYKCYINLGKTHQYNLRGDPVFNFLTDKTYQFAIFDIDNNSIIPYSILLNSKTNWHDDSNNLSIDFGDDSIEIFDSNANLDYTDSFDTDKYGPNNTTNDGFINGIPDSFENPDYNFDNKSVSTIVHDILSFLGDLFKELFNGIKTITDYLSQAVKNLYTASGDLIRVVSYYFGIIPYGLQSVIKSIFIISFATAIFGLIRR